MLELQDEDGDEAEVVPRRSYSGSSGAIKRKDNPELAATEAEYRATSDKYAQVVARQNETYQATTRGQRLTKRAQQKYKKRKKEAAQS